LPTVRIAAFVIATASPDETNSTLTFVADSNSSRTDCETANESWVITLNVTGFSNRGSDPSTRTGETDEEFSDFSEAHALPKTVRARRPAAINLLISFLHLQS
jgi:hypothetical protein